MPLVPMLSRVILAATLALAAAAHASYGVTPAMPVPNPDAEVATEALRSGDWQRAIDNFQAALKAEPDNAAFHSGLAHAYRRRGSSELAFRHFREALRIDPGLASAHEGIGEAYLAVGDVAKARDHLGILEQLCPGRSCQEVVDLERAIAAAK
jgi:Flp pilus assembly protein TadD